MKSSVLSYIEQLPVAAGSKFFRPRNLNLSGHHGASENRTTCLLFWALTFITLYLETKLIKRKMLSILRITENKITYYYEIFPSSHGKSFINYSCPTTEKTFLITGIYKVSLFPFLEKC